MKNLTDSNNVEIAKGDLVAYTDVFGCPAHSKAYGFIKHRNIVIVRGGVYMDSKEVLVVRSKVKAKLLKDSL